MRARARSKCCCPTYSRIINHRSNSHCIKKPQWLLRTNEKPSPLIIKKFVKIFNKSTYIVVYVFSRSWTKKIKHTLTPKKMNAKKGTIRTVCLFFCCGHMFGAMVHCRHYKKSLTTNQSQCDGGVMWMKGERRIISCVCFFFKHHRQMRVYENIIYLILLLMYRVAYIIWHMIIIRRPPPSPSTVFRFIYYIYVLCQDQRKVLRRPGNANAVIISYPLFVVFND